MCDLDNFLLDFLDAEERLSKPRKHKRSRRRSLQMLDDAETDSDSDGSVAEELVSGASRRSDYGESSSRDSSGGRISSVGGSPAAVASPETSRAHTPASSGGKCSRVLSSHLQSHHHDDSGLCTSDSNISRQPSQSSMVQVFSMSEDVEDLHDVDSADCSDVQDLEMDSPVTQVCAEGTANTKDDGLSVWYVS
mmetsp:Transcript_21349/g.49603  ORF Transcript_21349/g.49603 Transcript_21349/m.49603 type:complete len:193 (+) Transcript_21349:129-707(+)